MGGIFQGAGGGGGGGGGPIFQPPPDISAPRMKPNEALIVFFRGRKLLEQTSAFRLTFSWCFSAASLSFSF